MAPVRIVKASLARAAPVLSAQQLKWQARGALALTVLGALWLGVGLYTGTLVSFLSVLGVLAPGAALAATGRHVLRRADRLPRGPEHARAPWIFAWTSAVLLSAMVLVAVQLHRSHLDRYGASAIAALLALQGFVLGQALRSWVLHVTAAALFVAVISALLAAPWHPASLSSLGAGGILWVLNAVTLMPLLLAVHLAPLRASPEDNNTDSSTRCQAASRWGRPAAASTESIAHKDTARARGRQQAPAAAAQRPVEHKAATPAAHAAEPEIEHEILTPAGIPGELPPGPAGPQQAASAAAPHAPDVAAEHVAEKPARPAQATITPEPAVEHEVLPPAAVPEPEIRGRDSARRYRSEGRQQALASLVLRLLTIRFREQSSEVSTCIEAASEEELVAVAERLLAAPTPQQALGESLTARVENERTGA